FGLFLNSTNKCNEKEIKAEKHSNEKCYTFRGKNQINSLF
ncbi:hypothetical protein X975_17760, partial [Stegodyphus mimosarum]